MSKFDSNEILLKIAEKHDREAFKALVERYSEQLSKYAIVFIKNAELAEEIVSDVWLKIWNNRAHLTNVKSISDYLFIATRNQALTYRTRIDKNPTIAKDPQGSFDLYQQTETFTPHASLEHSELNAFLNRNISQLPDACQTAFRLVKEDGMSYQEAATKMNISTNTLKTHLSRAIKKLRMGMREHFSDFISK